MEKMIDRVRYDKPFNVILKYGTLFWLSCISILLMYGIFTIPDIFRNEVSWVWIVIISLSISILLLYLKIPDKLCRSKKE